MHKVFGLALLAATSAVVAQPVPVRPYVRAPGASAVVTLTQDRCFEWGEPSSTHEGNAITVTQTVRPRAACPTPGTDQRHLTVGPLESGRYRLTYQATAIDMPPIASHVREVDVLASYVPRTMRIAPANPSAMEPVKVEVGISNCEYIDGYRILDGGIELHIGGDVSNPVVCDVVTFTIVDIGAFAPGTYSVRAIGGMGDSGVSTFTVREAPIERPGAVDLSGVWSSPDEDPGTALHLVDYAVDLGDTPSERGIVGTWYRYGDGGAAVWYLIGLQPLTPGDDRRFAGNIDRVTAANPDAPEFLRTLTHTTVGTAQLDFDALGTIGHLHGTLAGEPFDVEIQRFRWTRSAWPAAAGASAGAMP